MKICIIGCGAIGSLFAAHLAREGEAEVFAYDVAQGHVRAINQGGLRVSGEADFTARLQASTDASPRRSRRPTPRSRARAPTASR